MTDQPSDDGGFFFGLMVRKDGAWTPHAKFDADGLGRALIKAEELDKLPDYDGVKVMRIPVNRQSASPPKEMWLSPRFRAQSAAQADAQVRAGAKQTKERLAAAHAARKAQTRKT